MKNGTRQSEDPVVQRLGSVARNSPDLSVAARLYEAILPLVRDADIRVSPLQIDQAVLRDCMAAGVPLLSRLDPEVDFQELEELMLRLIRAVELMDHPNKRPRRWKIWQRTSDVPEPSTESECRLLQAEAARIRRSYEAGRLDLGEILGYAACGNRDGVSEKAGDLQLDGNLLWTLAQNALKPALHDCRREIAPRTAGLHWDKGYCFVCGSAATLAELQDNDQVKHLRCGQCGSDWQVNRLQCLQCGNMDHTTQQTLSVDGDDSRRVEVCDSCHGYLKVIASFSPTPTEMLAVEDLATLHLDFIAQKRGYTNPI